LREKALDVPAFQDVRIKLGGELVAVGRNQRCFRLRWGTGENSRIRFRGLNWHLAPGTEDKRADDTEARTCAHTHKYQECNHHDGRMGSICRSQTISSQTCDKARSDAASFSFLCPRSLSPWRREAEIAR